VFACLPRWSAHLWPPKPLSIYSPSSSWASSHGGPRAAPLAAPARCSLPHRCLATPHGAPRTPPSGRARSRITSRVQPPCCGQDPIAESVLMEESPNAETVAGSACRVARRHGLRLGPRPPATSLPTWETLRLTRRVTPLPVRGGVPATPNTAPAGGGGFFFGFRPGLYSSSTGHVRWSGPTVLLRDKRDQEDRPLFPVGRARLFVPTPPCQISSECEGKHISASAGWWTCALTRGFHWPGNSFTGGVSGSARRLVEWWSPRACTGRIPDNVAPAVTRAHGDSVPVIHLGTSGRRSFVYGSSTNHPPWPHPLRTRMCLVPRSVNELLPPMVFSLPPASVRRLSITFVLAPLYHGRGASTGDTLLLSFFFARADNLLFSPLCS